MDVGLFDVLKFLHVTAAVLWLGGGAAVVVMGTRLLRGGSNQEVADLVKQVEWFGKRYFVPLSILVLLLGVGMVAESPIAFSETWVIIGLLGIVSTIAIGAGYLTPQGKKIADAIAERGVDDPSIRPMVTRLLAVARIDTIVLFVIVADMVLKPSF